MSLPENDFDWRASFCLWKKGGMVYALDIMPGMLESLRKSDWRALATGKMDSKHL